ncbi:MAG TPA: RDD family protein, partial [Dehalococcoidia bacterium]|nr:RDD family protein [Dehalococcoidia bacterium]
MRRHGAAVILPQCSAPPAHTCPLHAAPLSRRFAAYLLDWLLGGAVCVMLVTIAAAVLLRSSDLNRRDPSSLSLYAAIAIVSLWVPAWMLYAALAWTWFGATAGMALAGVRVVSQSGLSPGVWHSAARAFWLMLLTGPA